MPKSVPDHQASRLQKLRRLIEKGIDPYPPRVNRTHSNADARNLFLSHEQSDDAQAPSVTVAGRIIARRGMGRNTFIDLRDSTGKLQLQLRADLVGEPYNLLRDLDVGDFIEATGPMIRTRTGEVTVEARSLQPPGQVHASPCPKSGTASATPSSDTASATSTSLPTTTKSCPPSSNAAASSKPSAPL